MSVHSVARDVPPNALLIQMANAYQVSRIVYLAARLGLADHLAGGPGGAEELAKTTGPDPLSLYRMMRTLASVGILSQDSSQQFSLTDLGQALRSDAPGSARASVLTMAGDWAWRAWEQLPYAVETGKTGFERTFGKSVFEWLADHSDQSSLFSEAMAGFSGAAQAAVAEAYDFAELSTICDIGGATGNLLAEILRRYPDSTGIVLDLPHVVRDAPALIQSWSLADRMTVVGGSFFESIPTGCDAYLLSHVIHDWGDERCLTILENCRRAMKAEARLLIVEMVLPADDEPHPGKMQDMVMLVLTGGQERTEAEYSSLLSKAGLRLTRVVPTASPVSVVEATLE
jgi:hypothetical protein